MQLLLLQLVELPSCRARSLHHIAVLHFLTGNHHVVGDAVMASVPLLLQLTFAHIDGRLTKDCKMGRTGTLDIA